MSDLRPCPACGALTPPGVLAEAPTYPFWTRPDGACPACVQHNLLVTLLDQGDAALHERIQSVWPLDAGAAFGALPAPLRLHADPRFLGRGVTIALVDSGFYPHPDLTEPLNRIRAWVDAGRDPVHARYFDPDETPRWPAWDGAHGWQWHGLMTSTAAAGNGFLSHGLYRSLASEAGVVLIQARDEQGRITNETILRALRWLLAHSPDLGVRVVNLSVGGDPVAGPDPVDEAVAALVEAGVVVVAAAGNDGQRRLVPPATAPRVLTVGGLDDKNTFDHAEAALWHSNYGESSAGALKPELVAPSIWVAAPLLPGTDVAREARRLFERRLHGDRSGEARLAALKLVTPHYQHVDGTSFAAPLTAGAAACILEANPALSPRLVRDVLQQTACTVPGVPRERQGAGALDAGRAVALALREHHRHTASSPHVGPDGISFSLHDHTAHAVHVLGSWDGWRSGLIAEPVEAGVWKTPARRLPKGRHRYKFLLDGHRWLDDPDNPHKQHDDFGGFNSVLVLAA